jgi:hypothetical protein
MLRILAGALAVLSIASVGTADAATKHKKKTAGHAQPAPAMAAPAMAAPEVPSYARRPGPIGAGPNECYTDEGYGRYWPCGAGKN